MAKNKQRSIYLEDETWNEAKKKASEIGLSLSTIIRWFLLRWLRGEIEATIPQKESEKKE